MPISESSGEDARDAPSHEGKSDSLHASAATEQELERQANELKQANKDLFDSEQRLRLALATGKIGLWVWNSTDLNNAGDWSPRLKEIFGLPLETEVTHEIFLNCVHPEDRERVNKSIMDALGGADGGAYAAEYRAIHEKDGSQHWVTAKGQAFFNSEGQAIRFVGTVMDITERKREEELAAQLNTELQRRVAEHTRDLQRSEAFLNQAQKLTKTSGIWWRVKTGEIIWSEESYRLMEYEPSTTPTVELIMNRVHPEDYTLVEETVARSAREGADMDFKHRLLMPDGRVKHIRVLIQNSGIPGPDFEFVGAVMDITEQFKAQADLEEAFAKLKKSEDQLQKIIDTIPTLAWSANVDGMADFYSKRWLDYTGLSAREAAGEGWTAAIHPDDLERLNAEWMKFRASERPGEVEARLRRFDGEYRWFLFRVAPLLDEGGKVLKWYGTNADIEDRKRAEQKLRQNQSYLAYAQALSHSGNAIVKVSKGTFLWSEESARIYGYDPTILEPTAEMLMARIHPEDAAMVKDVLERAMRGGVTLDFEHRLLMPDGSVKHLHAVAHTVKDEAGNEEVLGAIVDVTKQKQIEEALRASERLARGQVEALRDILGFMSTEVNPDNFLEHVLFVTARQMDAHSLSVFSRNEDNTLTLEGLYLENKLIVPQEKTTYPTDDHPFWEECMKTGTECLVTELDRDPIWFRFVNRKNSEGAPRLNERTSSLVADAHTFIKAQGILLILAIPMVTCGRVSGFIRLMYTERREFLPVEMELCLSLAQQAALAMRLMQLSRKSQDAAVVSERNRLARDIHDTLAQGFTGIIAQLEAAKGSAQLAEASTHIERAESLARRSLDEARRSVQALRPLSLSNANLCEALKNMLETVGHYSLVKTEFVYEGESRPLSPEWEEVLLRVTQESLTNTMKHSKAQNFRATLKFEPEQVSLKLADDGCGFVPQAEHEGFGLIGMKERVNRIGGSFVVHSEPGAGTQTIVTLHSPSSSQLHAA